MPNQNYRAGRDFEYKVIGELKDNGYTLISRGAGSHGAVDIVMQKPGELLYVQAKTDGDLRVADRVTLRRLAAEVGAVPLLAYAIAGPRGGKHPAFMLLVEGGYAVWTPDHAIEGATR